MRGSRRLFPTPDDTAVGPIHYEVLEPMHKVRFRLEPNGCQPLAFDWIYEAALAPATEERTHQRAPLGYRLSADLVRYHQIGTASGWVELDGVRQEMDPDEWMSTRDHSWGVRYDVGTPPTDVDPFDPIPEMDFQMIWCPSLMTDPDGSRWGLFLHVVDLSGFGHEQRTITGAVEHADGTLVRMADIRPDLHFDPANRRLLGGVVETVLEDGTHRRFALEVPTATGFHLGAGLYFGWQGHHHGEWRGELVVDGERLSDCGDPDLARQWHQIRDTVVRVRDLDTGAEGLGNCQPIIAGEFPALGLTKETSFW